MGGVAVAASAGIATESPVELATEMKLANAGFVMRVAKSPNQLERLKTIPARRLVARTKDGGVIISMPIRPVASAY